MTAYREKVKIEECLFLLSAGDKDIADKYHKDMSQVEDFRTTRIEGILEVIRDELAEEIEREAQISNAGHDKGLAAGGSDVPPLYVR